MAAASLHLFLAEKHTPKCSNEVVGQDNLISCAPALRPSKLAKCASCV
jgi:hypothetical protein